MKSLIISETNHIKYLERAFKYENVPVKFLNYKKEELKKEKFLGSYSIIINLRKGEKEVYQKIKEMDKKILVLILVHKGRYKILKKKLPKNILIRKPFNFKKIGEKIKTSIYDYCLQSKKEIIIDDLRVNLSAREVYIKDKLIDLKFREFDLLEYFIENRGYELSKEKIMSWVWDRNNHFKSNTLEVHIKNLRKKLNTNNLITIPKFGYKFI